MSSANARNRRRGLAWALSSAVGGAFMAIPWKLANELGDPAISTLLLLLSAAIGSSGLQLGARLRTGVGHVPVGRTDLGVAAALAVFTLLGNHASAIAIQDISPALMNVLLRADFLFVAILGWILLGERVERRFWFGAVIAMTGLVVLQGPIAESGLSSILGSGTAMGIAAALCFSGMAITTRRFIHRIDPVAVNTTRLWLSVAFWFGLNDWPVIAEIPPMQALYAALAALFGPFLGRLALMQSARYVEARVTTLATLLTPLITLVLAWVILSDWPADRQLLGGAIMISGIAIPLLGRKRRV